jgi:hypothetical protein
MAFSVCEARPADLAKAVLCLDELSKDLKGELMIIDAEDHVCRTLDCRTLVVEHVIRAEVFGHDCDSELGKLFDGRFSVRDLTTVFAHGSGLRRGLHTGTFQWRTTVGILQGRLSGMTNEGTHREPAFQGCQTCGDIGVLEGRLCGRLVRASDPQLVGAQVTGAYRFRFDPNEKGGEGGLVGTIEGLVVRACEQVPECFTFDVLGDEQGSTRTVGPITIDTSDTNGPVAMTSVVTWAGITGLHLYHSSVITFGQTVSRVELTLAHFSQPPTVVSYDSNGTVVAGVTVSAGQQVPETLVLTGADIVRVEVTAPGDEVLLTRLCWAA